MKKAAVYLALCLILVGGGAVFSLAAGDAGDKVAFLAGKLSDDSFKVRLKAAVMLGRLADNRAVQPLLRAMRDDSYVVRGAAARALGNLGYPLAAEAVETLLDGVEDEEQFVRQEVSHALERLAGPESLDSFIAALSHQRPAVRLTAVRVLARLEDDLARSALIAALGDEDEEVRAEVTMFVKGLGSQEMGQWLGKALERQDNFAAQLAAAHLAGEMKLSSLLDPLAALLVRDDVVPAVRQEARQALRNMREFIDPKRALDQLASTNTAERDRAINLLGIQGGPEAVDALLGMLKSEEPFLLRRVVAALGDSGDARAIPALEFLLQKTEDRRLREQIERTLRALKVR